MTKHSYSKLYENLQSKLPSEEREGTFEILTSYHQKLVERIQDRINGSLVYLILIIIFITLSLVFRNTLVTLSTVLVIALCACLFVVNRNLHKLTESDSENLDANMYLIIVNKELFINSRLFIIIILIIEVLLTMGVLRQQYYFSLSISIVMITVGLIVQYPLLSSQIEEANRIRKVLYKVTY